MSMRDELYARVIGWNILEYLGEKANTLRIGEEVAEDALDTLEKIKRLLDDEKLDDSECYERIDRIVKAFYANGISLRRHDME